jgi:hypothetical protein
MTEQQQKDVLVETVRLFGRKEWFRDATVWDSFPTNGAPTLEIKVNYLPIFERKEVMDFAAQFLLQVKYTIVDRQGNPVE